MLVSVIISALNEEKYLNIVLKDILKQSYNLKMVELILINSMSTDNTLKIMNDFKNDYKNTFYDIKVLENIKKNQASGFNLGVKNSIGDVIVKIDAHSRITDNFLENNIIIINSGEYICGGPRPTIIKYDNMWLNTLNILEDNIFGSSISNYRNSIGEKYVNSVFHGMYRRDVFKNVGLVDELLGRTEDNEFNYRVRKNGYKIKYSDKIISYQFIRSNFRKMLKQKYGNGYWIGLTSHVCIECLSLFHFIPFLFLLAIILGLLLTFLSAIPIVLLFGVYLFLIIGISLISIVNNKFSITNLLLPILIFLVHISYGLGTLVGVLKGFSWKKYYLKNKLIEYL